MIFTHATIFCPDGQFRSGSFRVEDGRFTDVMFTPDLEGGVDLCSAKVLPGLVDLHTHGNSGTDFSTGDDLEAMMRFYARHGVTSVTPASMTVCEEDLERACRNAAAFAGKDHPHCARLAGINMEGPFFSYGKRGAQNPEFLRNPDIGLFNRLQNASGGRIRIACVAPELPGAAEFIREVSRQCTVSIAHTECSYDQAKAAIACGATHLTHLFNGMNGIHHRNAGPIGAGAEDESVYAELICDGLHVSPPAVRMAFKLFPGRICIISDSLGCAGLPDGQYDSGGMKVMLSEGLARLEDGTIAGSTCTVYSGLLNCIRFGIDEATAILAATANPARQAGIFGEVGSIENGKAADFLVCGEDYTLREVYVRGERVDG